MQSPARKAQVFNKEHAAPKAPREEAHRDFHGTEVEDNYATLEHDSEERQAWLDAQKDRLSAYTTNSEHHGAHPEMMEEIFPPYDESGQRKAGDKFFSIMNDGTQDKNVLVVRDGKDAEPQVLFDPNVETDRELEHHSLISNFQPNEDGSKIIVSFTSGGTANSYAYVLDMEKKEILEAYGSDRELKWVDGKPDTLVHLGGHQEKNHYCLQEHIVGDDPANNRTIFEFNSKERMGYTKHLTIKAEMGEPAAHEFLTMHSGTQRDNGVFFRAKGEVDAFDLLFDDLESTAKPVAEVNGKLLMLTDRDAPMSRLVEVDYDNPEPENWKTIIPEDPKRDLESVDLVKGKLVANYIENAQSRMAIFATGGEHLHDVPLPDNVSASLHDTGKDGDIVRLAVRSFTSTVGYDYDIATNEVEKKDPAIDDPERDGDLVVKQIEATSKDGTKVPMTVVHRKDVEMDGSAASILTGYGGFDIPMMPSQDAAMQHFIEQGGVFAQANLRGGGEGGAKWYDEGRLENKQNVFDDFAACAETLSQENYTSPERLMAKGASNGGLLVLATALQRPELFGSVVAHAPVADLMDAATWPSDYGVPRQSKEDFETAIKYSPLQNIKEGQKYPPMMVCVAENDDIVPEHEGMKFVAAMNEKSPDTLCMLHRELDAGHYAGQLKTRPQVIEYQTTLHDFAEESLGPINQQQYKEAAAEWEHAIEEEKPRAKQTKGGADARQERTNSKGGIGKVTIDIGEGNGKSWREKEESRKLENQNVEVRHQI